ncbi:MAG: hypothetical protein CMB77_04025 [Euryarchaeota archaeon]|nr:hypothetical protein [Euryarchaeota archaeon]|tara:strand:+ start:19609 stop:20208 length:600 start_codon:yes stop_codon:yes gene_type:complete
MKRNPRFEIFTGPMFGGKTTRLIAALDRYQYQNKSILLFKPKIDNRYDKNSVVTHSGLSLSSRTVGFSRVENVANGDELLERFEYLNSGCDIDVVAVDEAFMIGGSASALKAIYNFFGKTILVSSLQLSSSGESYKEILDILPWATNIQICPAVCAICGEDAYFTQKIAGNNDPGKLEIGGSDLYQPRCHNHFNPQELL